MRIVKNILEIILINFTNIKLIPPLIGFFSKQFVLYAAIQKGFYFISIVAIIVSVISASYYLNTIKILHVYENDSKNSLLPQSNFSTEGPLFGLVGKASNLTSI